MQPNICRLFKRQLWTLLIFQLCQCAPVKNVFWFIFILFVDFLTLCFNIIIEYSEEINHILNCFPAKPCTMCRTILLIYTAFSLVHTTEPNKSALHIMKCGENEFLRSVSLFIFRHRLSSTTHFQAFKFVLDFWLFESLSWGKNHFLKILKVKTVFLNTFLGMLATYIWKRPFLESKIGENLSFLWILRLIWLYCIKKEF